MFAWGCSDEEPIETSEDVNQFKQALTDLTRAAGHKTNGKVDNSMVKAARHTGSLYAARRRGMRPQGACYPKDKRLWSLFDACGPEREKGIGNPYAPGEYNPDRMKSHSGELSNDAGWM